MRDVKAVVVGLGYVGLPTAALIASKGISVHGVDINPGVVKKVGKGEIHIVEPDLEGLVALVVKKGLLKAGQRPVEADVFLIAVPTPFKDGHEPDISFVESAVEMITPFLRKGSLVILESTSPVGTTNKMASLILSRKPGLKGKIHVAYCPERVLPGKILYELEHNDRVIGGVDEESTGKAVEFYTLFTRGVLHATDSKTAEMCKLAENAYRDVNIAFANEMSMICDKSGINVWDMISLANRHPRVNILKPGPGVGGHCIAVDPWFIVASAPDDARLIRMARDINEYKETWVVEKVKGIAAKYKNPVIGCLGISYKADIDDFRESPALKIIKGIMAADIGKVMVCDPHAGRSFKEFPVHGFSEVIRGSDIIVVLVDHREFKNIDRRLIQEKNIIDTRGVWL